jgi:hypothetical protein
MRRGAITRPPTRLFKAVRLAIRFAAIIPINARPTTRANTVSTVRPPA